MKNFFDNIIFSFLLLFLGVISCQFEEYAGPDWNNVPLLTSLPTNEKMKSTERSNTFGNCICDITLNQCDYNCVCDPDCSEDEIKQFSGLLKQHYSRDFQNKKCFPSKTVFNNLPDVSVKVVYPFWGVCVYYETNPALGYYWTYHDDISSENEFKSVDIRNSLQEFKKKEEFLTMFEDESGIRSKNSDYDGKYFVGDLIPFRRKINGIGTFETPYRYVDKLFSIPSPVYSNKCSSNNHPQFLKEISNQECEIAIDSSNLADLCSSSLDPNKFIREIFLSKKSFINSMEESDYVQVNLEFLNDVGVEINDITVSYSVGVCTNALKSISYYITYGSAEQNITKVEAEVTTDTVTDNDGFFTQSFSVYFLELGVSTINDAVSGKMRGKSGNPGYVKGLPVLAGREEMQAGKRAIIQLVNGLEVPFSVYCNNIDVNSNSFVGFNEDLSSSCKINVNESYLQQICVPSFIDFFIRPQGVNTVNPSNSTHVGKYGNSDMNNIKEWIEIQKDNDFPTTYWNPANKTCVFIPSIINFQFIIARTGPIRNEQFKIIGAKRSFITENWAFDETKSVNYFYRKWYFTFVEDITQLSFPTTTPVRSFIDIPRDWLYPLRLLIGGGNTVFINLFVLFCLIFALMDL